jgi:hypothetical protein
MIFVQKNCAKVTRFLRIFLNFFKINIFRQWVGFNSSDLANSSWMIAGVATSQKWGEGGKKKNRSKISFIINI